jgi:hypothetical protein
MVHHAGKSFVIDKAIRDKASAPRHVPRRRPSGGTNSAGFVVIRMQGSILQGVKRAQGSLAGRLAQRVKGLLMPRSDAVTYSVVESETAHPASGDRRNDARRRTRLRSGKVVDPGNRFIVECQIRERSQEGARLLLVKPAEIPDRIGLFDDSELSIRTAEIIWRQALEIGIRFTPEHDSEEIKESDLAALSGKFYAVGK